MSHQVLSNKQFAGYGDTNEEKSIDSTKLRDEIPEEEDENIDAEGTRISP